MKCSSLFRTGILILGAAVLIVGIACSSSKNHPIAFVSTVEGGSKVMSLDVDTGESKSLIDNHSHNSDPRWSPNGQLLAYVSDKSGNLEINLVDRNGMSITQLTNSFGDDVSPRWSPNGSRIAFISHRDGQPEVYLMNNDGTNPTRVTSNIYEDWMGDWSPDEEWLVFYTLGSDETQGLWLRNPDGVNLIHLTSGRDSTPVWSPDGQHIAFVRTENQMSDIFITSKSKKGVWQDRSELKRLTMGNGQNVSPSWSPDNKSLAFVSYGDGTAEIYKMSLNGSKPVRLTRNQADDLDPEWSRDGKSIVFVSEAYGSSEIVLMDADGTNQRRLTNDIYEDHSPRW